MNPFIRNRRFCPGSGRAAGALLVVSALLGGCSTFDGLIESKKIDYKSAGRLPPLEIPPDLTRPQGDERFSVPDTGRPPSGSATYSAYAKERGAKPAAGSTGILPNQVNSRIERAGSQRWLVVTGDPEKLWSSVKEFWLETGFIVNIEQADAGVMETDWAENRAKINDGPIRNILGKVLNSVSSTAERDKFRTRLERGAEGTTEIYVSHRGMVEVYANEGKDRTMWQPRAADPDLEAEMLRRLMVRLGVDDAKARAQLVAETGQPRARIVKTQDGSGRLDVSDQFDRAWRRVGLALDRVGFTVEDRDRSKGLYFVRYLDPEADVNSKQDKGFLAKLAFWRGTDDKKKNEQFRIRVQDTDAGSAVNVLNKEGAAEKSETANRILTLLFDQLK